MSNTNNMQPFNLNKQQSWNVFIGDNLIDTVFYDKNLDADYVRDGLVNHDGYPAEIEVVKG